MTFCFCFLQSIMHVCVCVLKRCELVSMFNIFVTSRGISNFVITLEV